LWSASFEKTTILKAEISHSTVVLNQKSGTIKPLETGICRVNTNPGEINEQQKQTDPCANGPKGRKFA
jgi:hypothetical protein